ncbi:MAG: helix-turn-helix domain-containing protein [Candidatus Obscuribacterales bacterium]
MQVECPISKLLDIISAKWAVEVLREVCIGPTRTRKFLRAIPGLSMKSLQCRLKELEEHGLIERIDYGETPRRVEHNITERGKRVLAIMAEIKQLSDEMFNVGSDCVCPIEAHDEAGIRSDFNCPKRSARCGKHQ